MSKIQMTRHNNWEQILSDFYLETDNNGLALDWGSSNCAAWSLEAVKRMTGVDLYEEFVGKVDSPQSAYKAIKAAGFDTFDELVASRLEEVPMAFAKRGDLCLYPVEADQALYHGPSAVLGGAALGEGSTAQSLGMSYAMCLAEPPHVWALIATGKISLPITKQCIFFKVGE